MQAVFLSDAHIQSHDDPSLPPLVAFLEKIAGTIDRLFVVGDLFHTWFGFRRVVFDEYVPLLGTLHALKRAGTQIVYVTGNHDYEMGHFFEEILDAEVHDSEMTLDLDGQKAFVAHGDLTNQKDRSCRVLRGILHARLSRWLGRRLPPSWIWRLGQGLVRSCSGNAADHAAFAPVFQDYAARKFDEGCSTVILGHSHVPVFREERAGATARTYVNLGDWVTHRTFLRWDHGRLRLKQWTWPDAVEKDFAPPTE